MESVSTERRLCRGLNDVCFLRENEGEATAGPSTTLRSGRDDTSLG
jgi:hypothetical protein